MNSAKQEVLIQSTLALTQIRQILKKMESDLLGDDETLVKQRSCELVYLHHFIENHLLHITTQSVAEYLFRKQEREALN